MPQSAERGAVVASRYSDRNWARLIALAVMLAMTLAAAACGGDDDSGDSSADAAQGSTTGEQGNLSGETIKIGFVGPLSGPFQAAGTAMVQGSRAAIDYLNSESSKSGATFELIERDDGGDPAKSAVAGRELVAEGVTALLTPLTPGSTPAVQPFLTDGKVVNFGGQSGQPAEEFQDGGKFQYTLSNGVGDEQITLPVLKFAAVTLGVKKLGELYSSDPLGIASSKLTAVQAPELGMELVSESFPPTQRDVTEQLRTLQDAGVDALVVWAFGDPLVVVTQGLTKLGWEPTLLTQMGAMNPAIVDLLTKQAPSALENMVSGPFGKSFIAEEKGASPSNEVARTFIEYMGKQTKRPFNGSDIPGVYGFDPVIGLDAGLAMAGGSTEGKDIVNALSEKSVLLTHGMSNWPNARYESNKTEDYGMLRTDSDLSSGTGQAPATKPAE